MSCFLFAFQFRRNQSLESVLRSCQQSLRSQNFQLDTEKRKKRLEGGDKNSAEKKRSRGERYAPQQNAQLL